MIGTALFLLCATAIAHADLDDTELDGFYDNGCPKDTSVEKCLPHEDCEQFYQCFRGELISRYCPNGLHFNADLEKCDWLGKANCHNKRDEGNGNTFEELDKNNPSHATLICSSPDSNNVLVAHKNCNQFFKCSYGRALVLNCAENLLYNIVNEKCDVDENVKCSERLRPGNDQAIDTTTNKYIGFSYSIEEIDQSNSDPSQAIVQCSAKRSDGVLVAHEYCNKFYKCSGGVPVTIKCPSTLFYDPIMKHCDWPANVDCDGRTIPEIYDGSHARRVEKHIKTADSPMNENSDDDDDDISPAAICAANNSNGLMIAHEKCNHFYKCKWSKPVAYTCPGDLLFNSKENYCDWPHNIDCGERLKPKISASEKNKQYEDPSQVRNICSAEDSDGVLVAHESCHKFYKCHDGSPVEITCPGILLYNPKKEFCDWPTHVKCDDRTVPENGWSLKEDDENNIDSSRKKSKKKKGKRKHRRHNKVRSGTRNKNQIRSQPAKTCADERFDGKFLPHENCNQFYKCFEGKAVALFCPLNLFYNIDKKYCDWPHNVNCSNRVVPGNYINDEKDGNTNLSCQGEVDGTICSSTREVQSVL